jgi:hypothetical protein
MITPFGIAWIVATNIAVAIAVAIAGWFCIFRTGKMVAMGRRNYEKSKFIQAYPFPNFVLKDSYPTYIRCAGIFIWVWLIAFLCFVIFGHFR